MEDDDTVMRGSIVVAQQMATFAMEVYPPDDDFASEESYSEYGEGENDERAGPVVAGKTDASTPGPFSQPGHRMNSGQKANAVHSDGDTGSNARGGDYIASDDSHERSNGALDSHEDEQSSGDQSNDEQTGWKGEFQESEGDFSSENSAKGLEDEVAEELSEEAAEYSISPGLSPRGDQAHESDIIEELWLDEHGVQELLGHQKPVEPQPEGVLSAVLTASSSSRRQVLENAIVDFTSVDAIAKAMAVENMEAIQIKARSQSARHAKDSAGTSSAQGSRRRRTWNLEPRGERIFSIKGANGSLSSEKWKKSDTGAKEPLIRRLLSLGQAEQEALLHILEIIDVKKAEGVSISTILDQLNKVDAEYLSRRDAQCQTSADGQMGGYIAEDSIEAQLRTLSPERNFHDASPSRTSVEFWALDLQVLSTWGSKSHAGLTEVRKHILNGVAHELEHFSQEVKKSWQDAFGNSRSLVTLTTQIEVLNINVERIADVKIRIPDVANNAQLYSQGRHHHQSEGYNLANLTNGHCQTTEKHLMWLGYTKKRHSSLENHNKAGLEPKPLMEVSILVPATIAMSSVKGLRIWNYNHSLSESCKGVRDAQILFGKDVLWKGTVRKGCGSRVFDFSTFIDLTHQLESISKCCREIKYPQSKEPHEENLWAKPIIDSDERVDRGGGGGFQRRHQRSEGNDAAQSARTDNTAEEKYLPRQSPPVWLSDVKLEEATTTILDDKFTNMEAITQSRQQSRKNRRRRPFTERSKSFSHTAKLNRLLQDDGQDRDENLLENDVDEDSTIDMSLDSLEEFKLRSLSRIAPHETISAANGISHLSVDISTPSKSGTVVIPSEPRGESLLLRLLSTWGDVHYIGLAGVELFDADGRLIGYQLSDGSSSSRCTSFEVFTSPSDKGDDECCGKERLVNGVCLTMDELQHWLSPFVRGLNSEVDQNGGQNTIEIKFPETTTLSAIRIWNYNARRVYLDRGVRDLEIRFDDNIIFRGEIARAPGSLSYKEQTAEYILLTKNPKALAAIEEHEKSFYITPFIPALQLQILEKERPSTGSGPIACLPPDQSEAEHQRSPINDTEKQFSELDELSTRINSSLRLELQSSWSPSSEEVGLTGLQLIGPDGPISLKCRGMIETSSDVPPAGFLYVEPSGAADDASLVALLDGSPQTAWLTPLSAASSSKPDTQRPSLVIQFSRPTLICALQIWNYHTPSMGSDILCHDNDSDDCYKGARSICLLIDEVAVGQVFVRKAYNNDGQTFLISSIIEAASQREITPAGELQEEEKASEICGCVVQLRIFSTHGDRDYVGLNGLEFIGRDDRPIAVEKAAIHANPASINEIPGSRGNDHRTIDKLIDGVNETFDDQHMWLAPFGGNWDHVDVVVTFDEPVCIKSVIVWNYAKTPQRGASDIQAFLDHQLVYQGRLSIAPSKETSEPQSFGSKPEGNLPKYKAIDLHLRRVCRRVYCVGMKATSYPSQLHVSSLRDIIVDFTIVAKLMALTGLLQVAVLHNRKFRGIPVDGGF